MSAGKSKSVSSLIRAAIKTASKTSLTTEDATLKQFVSSLDTSSPTTSSSSETTRKFSITLPKLPSRSKNSASKAVGDFSVQSLKIDAASHLDDSTKELAKEISSILLGATSLDTAISPDSFDTYEDNSLERVLEIPWFPSMTNNNISLRRKEVSRNRKQKWIFKSSQVHRFDKLVRMCAKTLGTDATIQVFGKLGRETGVKEYNALIGICIEEARKSEDEEALVQEIHKAYRLFKSMKEHGFQLEEETYGPFLMFLIDMEMAKEFEFFCGVVYDENPHSLARIAYYEMLFWVRADNEDKIKELCDYIAANDDDDKRNFKENYLLALCESERKKEILQLLEIIDITKFSSLDQLASIFRSLGRLSLESFLEKFILALKSLDIGSEITSDFLLNYAVSMPNLAVEDIILQFNNLHCKFDVTPSSMAYEKLIRHCCDSLKVHVALDIVDQMSEVGLALSIETFHLILHACEESRDYNLVHRIYSVIRHNNLKPTSETFRSMINLSVRMKDFQGAFNMINDLKKANLQPTSIMYNTILAGYIREARDSNLSLFSGGLWVKLLDIA
ncbi:hypothetical protein U1Q18_024108 [Sarracenia purpurea var. burkii]